MSDQKPPNRQQIAEKLRQEAVYLRAAQEALQKQLAIPKSADAEVRIDDERKTLESERLRLEVKRLSNRLDEAEDVYKLRKRYTNRLFWLTVGWLIAVVTFIALAAFHVKGFTLSDSVIIAFITSTTVSVIGLFLIPAKWLFPAKDDESAK